MMAPFPGVAGPIFPWADALELARLFYVRFLGSLINLATLSTSAAVLPSLHKKKLIGCNMACNLIGLPIDFRGEGSLLLFYSQ